MQLEELNLTDHLINRLLIPRETLAEAVLDRIKNQTAPYLEEELTEV